MEIAAVQSRQKLESDASKKRQSMADEISNSTKRRRLDADINPGAVFSEVGTRRGADPGRPSFDVTALPLQSVIDFLLASFQSVQPDTLSSAIRVNFVSTPFKAFTAVDFKFLQDARQILPASEAANLAPSEAPRPASLAPEAEVMIDPLKLDLGDEELDLKTEIPAAEMNVCLFCFVFELTRGTDSL